MEGRISNSVVRGRNRLASGGARRILKENLALVDCDRFPRTPDRLFGPYNFYVMLQINRWMAVWCMLWLSGRHSWSWGDPHHDITRAAIEVLRWLNRDREPLEKFPLLICMLGVVR